MFRHCTVYCLTNKNNNRQTNHAQGGCSRYSNYTDTPLSVILAINIRMFARFSYTLSRERRCMGILDVVGPDRSSVFIVGCTGPAPCAMADQSLAALLDARQTVDHALAQTRAELRRATRRAATDARHWVLPARLQNTTVAMYQLAGATEPAVKYLKTCAAERHWPDRTDIELTGLVEDIFWVLPLTRSLRSWTRMPCQTARHSPLRTSMWRSGRQPSGSAS